MPDFRHPDIEIYLKNCSQEQVLTWLKNQCQSVEVVKTSGSTLKLHLSFPMGDTQATLQQKVSGKAWSSLWFNTNNTPWPTDLECAKNAASKMQIQVRCFKERWSEEDAVATEEEEQWWKIEHDSCELISWRG